MEFISVIVIVCVFFLSLFLILHYQEERNKIALFDKISFYENGKRKVGVVVQKHLTDFVTISYKEDGQKKERKIRISSIKKLF